MEHGARSMGGAIRQLAERLMEHRANRQCSGSMEHGAWSMEHGARSKEQRAVVAGWVIWVIFAV